MSEPLPNHRLGRQRHLVRALEASTWVVGVAAALTLLLPDDLADHLGWAVLIVLGATPLLRVAWLGVRWARLGDRRFALTALSLLVVVVAGAALGS